MRLAVDIETDGLLHELTRIHCIVAINIDTQKVYTFGPHQIDQAILFLANAELLIAHNGINFDIPAIQKLYPDFQPKCVLDTLVLSRLVRSNQKTYDSTLVRQWKKTNGTKGLPGKLYGSHSLEAWGYRLGDYKGDFKPENYGLTWQTIQYSREMLEYCVQDVRVTVKLYKMLSGIEYSQQAIWLEHQVAWLMAQQERNGFCFDVESAQQLYALLLAEREALRKKLCNTFGSWYEAVNNKDQLRSTKRIYNVTIPKRTVNYKDRPGTVKGRPYTKISLVEFNPGSRQHIAKRLSALYGWIPQEFTDNGEPKVDETVLSKLPYEEAQELARYFLVQKRLGQLAEGDNGWLKLERGGKIHGSVNPNGAVTGRATHNHPNVAQVPSG